MFETQVCILHSKGLFRQATNRREREKEYKYKEVSHNGAIVSLAVLKTEPQHSIILRISKD